MQMVSHSPYFLCITQNLLLENFEDILDNFKVLNERTQF